MRLPHIHRFRTKGTEPAPPGWYGRRERHLFLLPGPGRWSDSEVAVDQQCSCGKTRTLYAHGPDGRPYVGEMDFRSAYAPPAAA